jgi:SAM-dependent methyltransferase
MNEVSRKIKELFEQENGKHKNQEAENHGYLKYLSHFDEQVGIWKKFFGDIYRGSKNDKILDFGCGSSVSIYTGKTLGFSSIKGVDINHTNETGAPFFSDVHNICETTNEVSFYDGQTLPYEDNTFDAIICNRSLTKDDLESKGGSMTVIERDKLTEIYKNRIKELKRISKSNSIWYIGPKKDFDKVKKFYKFDSSDLNLIFYHR